MQCTLAGERSDSCRTRIYRHLLDGRPRNRHGQRHYGRDQRANTSSSITSMPEPSPGCQLLVPARRLRPGLQRKTDAHRTGSRRAIHGDGECGRCELEPVNTVSDTVAITSSDVNATMPSPRHLSLAPSPPAPPSYTGGSQTLTASDTTDGTKASNTSPSITVNAGTFTRLQILVPGETACTRHGWRKNRNARTQTAGTAFNVRSTPSMRIGT